MDVVNSFVPPTGITGRLWTLSAAHGNSDVQEGHSHSWRSEGVYLRFIVESSVITLRAEGHENVQGTHASTFELTTDEYLTPAGDCIIGINADLAPSELPDGFISECQQQNQVIAVKLRVGSQESVIRGYGHPDLTFKSDRSFVFRTSTHIDDRTVMIRANKAAVDINRDLIKLLSRGNTLTATLTVGTAGAHSK